MSETTTENDDRNPFTRPGFILSAALIVALIAAVLVIAFLPRNGNDEATTPSPAETSAAATNDATSTEEPTAEESTCGLPDSGETALGTAPETTWELVGNFAAPTSPEQHGPGVVSDDVRSCFSHDVTGALYAAVNVAALASSGQEQKLYSELAVPSPAQERALSSASAPAPASTTSVQVAGFRIDSYTEDAAVVRLGIRGSNGVNLDYPVPLEWHEGDWKLVVPPTGDPGVREVPDLTEFLPWAGA
jgi:hypothetical protein